MGRRPAILPGLYVLGVGNDTRSGRYRSREHRGRRLPPSAPIVRGLRLQKESQLPSIMPRVVMRLALVVAIQLAVVALLILAAPRALSALADCLVHIPAGAMSSHIESSGAARAQLAGVLGATLADDDPLPILSDARVVLAVPDDDLGVVPDYWPQEWPAELSGRVGSWLEGGATDRGANWCTVYQDGALFVVGAAPHENGEGWVLVLADDTRSLGLWAAERAGALSFAIRPAGEVSDSATLSPALSPTLRHLISGSLEVEVDVPGLVGDPVVISFTVSTSGIAFVLRALAIVLGASVLLVAGVQALTFASTYVQVMHPVKDIMEALRQYVATGAWNPPPMRFREPQAALDAVTHAMEAQKQAEAEALDLVSQLRAFLDALPAAAAIKGADLRLRMVNSELARLAQREPEELIGKTDQDIYPERLARMYTYHDRQVVESGETLQFEEVLDSENGARRTFRTVKAPIFDGDGNVSGLVSLAIDITREREMQARLMEAQKAQLMGRLAGGVAHIFNNVLTAVIGSTELALLSLGEEHVAREDLAQVKEAAERGARVSRQLLYLGRRQRTGDGPSSVNSVVNELLPVLCEMGGSNVKVVTQIGDEVPDVLVDAGELRQVVLHLALNAIEAMSDGGKVRIESCSVVAPPEALMVEPSLSDKPTVLIRVEDSGPGIVSEARDHLFEPFYTTKGSAGGRGLGLSVVHSIVRNHQGAVLFQSEPGAGAVFDVYLPARAATEELSEPHPASADGVASGGEVILLAEDEPSVRELTERMLVSQGYTLWSAGRGDEALRLVESRGVAPDLVLTDVMMPGMSGIDLALALRARYPEVPVLLMSGYVGESDDDDLKGFPLLWKPFTLESLTQSIRGLLDQDET